MTRDAGPAVEGRRQEASAPVEAPEVRGRGRDTMQAGAAW